jgi:hypothetical protein
MIGACGLGFCLLHLVNTEPKAANGMPSALDVFQMQYQVVLSMKRE